MKNHTFSYQWTLDDNINVDNYDYHFDNNGVCDNPICFFIIHHTDLYSYDDIVTYNMNPKRILFALIVAKHQGKFYSGFYYNPDEISDHYMPICTKFSRPIHSYNLAVQNAIDSFLHLYNDLNFQYRAFIFQKINQIYKLNLKLSLNDVLTSSFEDFVNLKGRFMAKNEFAYHSLQTPINTAKKTRKTTKKIIKNSK